MTLINLTPMVPILGPDFHEAAHVTVVAEPWAGSSAALHTHGPELVIPAPVRVEMPGVLDLEPNQASWCWRLIVRDDRGNRRVVRYVTVPDGGPIDWPDLVDVDPATYQPADPTPTLLETIDRQVAAYLAENPAASPEEIAAAVEAYLAENPVEGVTQAQLDAAIAGIELTPGPPGEPGPPGPSAVSADAGNLLKLGTDSLPLLDPADLPSGGGASTGWIEQPVPGEVAGTATIQWWLRREGSIVYMAITIQGTPAGTNLGVLPAGFGQPSILSSLGFPIHRQGTTSIVNAVSIVFGGQVRILTQSTIGGIAVFSWPTDAPWPLTP